MSYVILLLLCCCCHTQHRLKLVKTNNVTGDLDLDVFFSCKDKIKGCMKKLLLAQTQVNFRKLLRDSKRTPKKFTEIKYVVAFAEASIHQSLSPPSTPLLFRLKI